MVNFESSRLKTGGRPLSFLFNPPLEGVWRKKFERIDRRRREVKRKKVKPLSWGQGHRHWRQIKKKKEREREREREREGGREREWVSDGGREGECGVVEEVEMILESGIWEEKGKTECANNLNRFHIRRRSKEERR